MKAVVVLGSRVLGIEIHDELRMRLDVSAKIFDEDSVFILSGGYTNEEIEKSEAQVMSDYLTGIGIPIEKIYLEEESLDTIGNGYFVRRMVDAIPGITRLAVVSSCYHMKRSEYIFRNCFSDGIELDFSHCADFHREILAEDESMEMARNFFSGISHGDAEAIGKRLYSTHLMYNGKNGQ